MNPKPYVLALILLLAGLGLTGCWDMVEVSRSTLITGAALEPTADGGIRVTIEVLNSAESMHMQGGTGSAPSQLYTNEAPSIPEAVVRMNEKLGRMLISSHLQVIIVDEKLAREGLDRFIDFIQRSRYIREDVTILVAKKVRASDLLRIPFPSGMYAGQSIQAQVTNYSRMWGGVVKSDLYAINQSTLIPGRELLLGAATVAGQLQSNDSIDSVKSLEPKASVQMAGSAVFRDGKLIGYLSNDETRFAMLVNDKLRHTTFSFPLQKDRFASVRMVQLRVSRKVVLKDGRPSITVSIAGNGVVTSLDSSLPLDRIAGYRELNRLLSDYVKELAEGTIRSVQKNQRADIFGFGETLYRHRYRQFKPIASRWNDLFAQADVEVVCRLQVERSELKSKKLSENPFGQ